MTLPIQEVVERDVNPGIGLFELVDYPERVGAADWKPDMGAVRIATGRLGLLTKGRDYRPEIVLRAWTTAPSAVTSATDDVATRRHEPVLMEFQGRHVEVWSGDVMPGTVKLALPAATDDSFWVRVTVEELADHPGSTIDDFVDAYFAEYGHTPIGVERFTIDFWPAELADSTSTTDPEQMDADDETTWLDPIEDPGREFESLTMNIASSSDTVLELVDDTDRVDQRDWSTQDTDVVVSPGRWRLKLPAVRPLSVRVRTLTGPPAPGAVPSKEVRTNTAELVVAGEELHLWSANEYAGPISIPQSGHTFQVRAASCAADLNIDIWPIGR